MFNLNAQGPEPKVFIDMDGPQLSRGVPHSLRKQRFSMVGGVLREHINWRPKTLPIPPEVLTAFGLTAEQVRINERRMYQLVGDARRFHCDMGEAFRTMGTPAFTPTFQRMLGAWRKWWSRGVGLARRSRMRAMLSLHVREISARANKSNNAEASKPRAGSCTVPIDGKQRKAA